MVSFRRLHAGPTLVRGSKCIKGSSLSACWGFSGWDGGKPQTFHRDTSLFMLFPHPVLFPHVLSLLNAVSVRGWKQRSSQAAFSVLLIPCEPRNIHWKTLVLPFKRESSRHRSNGHGVLRHLFHNYVHFSVLSDFCRHCSCFSYAHLVLKESF